MPQKAKDLRSDLIDRVARLVRGKVPRAKAHTAEAFVRRFYANLAADDLRRRSPEDQCCAALGIWKFAAQRRPGEAKIRVYDPRADTDGWDPGHTVIEIVNDDMPFLVDSVRSEMNYRNTVVHIVVHPIVRVRRGKGGRLLGLAPVGENATPDAIAESFIQVEIAQQPAKTREDIAASLTAVLADVRRSVEDWHLMRARIDEIIAELHAAPPPVDQSELTEVMAFLEWIRDDHFTFLGLRSYDLTRKGDKFYHHPIPDSGLGILRTVSPDAAARHAAPLPPQTAAFARRKELLMIAKANTRSTVHRSVPLDFLGVRRFGPTGEVIGEHRILGLFTSIAYSQSPRYIPVLRRKVLGTIARAGFSPASHDGKVLLHILETYPRDELFQISEADLRDISLGILQLQERQRIALFARDDPFGRYVSCLVFVPRDGYDTALRLRFQAILEEALKGTVSATYTQVSDEPLARLHFIVSTPGEIPDYDTEAIETRLAAAGRSWRDALREALIRAKGEGPGLKLLAAFGEAFPAGYRDRFGAEAAVFDIDKVEEASRTGALGTHMDCPTAGPSREARLKIYHRHDPVALSDVLPMLENLGFHVVSEMPFAVTPKDGDGTVWIHEFLMHTAAGTEIDQCLVGDKLQACLGQVWTGEVENDGFNRLVVAAGLAWREIVVLRAYCKYLRQAAIPFSETYMQRTLACNPEIARLIVRLFNLRFDPRDRKLADVHAVETKVQIEEALDGVTNLDEDRILRRFFNLTLATLRTNFFQKDPSGGPKPYVSFKFDSRLIDGLPRPRPMYEIFVYSPHVEAVHLRGGKVARGGIRWSDRREDFRTEVLGLMKAQMVKNAVIVPVGSKGGFVVKRPPPPAQGREALMTEVIACYKTMMRGMLDLTDNFKRDAMIAPSDVVVYDEDDPYLVVAADKGTATFSDIANAISEEYDFWLGDAFASGGSVGYDHKKMGITARGAWESVKRHFREMGRDIQRQDFTVVGVGDMAGDVFGNGMLLSRQIRLIGAFNHMHIFIDPDPDPKASHQERRRLFRKPRSSWADYRPELISEGGGVFERKAKWIQLTAPMKAQFGLSGDRISPSDLIRAMLRAEADLLWFGGIGTYIKAHDESDADVGDRANDALRVDARDLRCRVIGEGANLGVTQRGRIEFALAGGRINTDAIDNSAGVDCSDHEVNIKIPLGDLMTRGAMSRKRRDTLLRSMTDEVAALVLRDNYLQNQAIALAEARGVEALEQNARLIRSLERLGRLDRGLEFLPDDETLAERQNAGRGLARPEISVLLAYAKISLFDDLLNSDFPDDPQLAADLLRYFPEPLQKTCRSAISRHRLRREIIATSVTNSMVNRVGSAFVNEMKERTGMGAPDIARAYAVTRNIFGLHALWAGIEAQDNKLAATTQTEMMVEIGRLVERVTLWFLRCGAHPLDVAHYCDEYGPGIARIRDSLADIVAPVEAERLAHRAEALVELKVPRALARSIASLDLLASALDIVRIALGGNLAVDQVGRLYFSIGARFGLDWLRGAAADLTPETWWQKEAVAAVIEDLYGHQRELTTKVLDVGGGTDIAEHIIDAWAEAKRHAVARAESLLADLKAAPSVDLAMLAVANRVVRSMISA